MILTCPSCATSYFAPDDAIGATGRRVRCQSCATTWHARSEEPLELTAATVTASTDAAPAFGRRDDATESSVETSLAETPAPELPKAFRARAEQQRRLRRAATHGAVWAGLASGFVGLFVAGWLFRVEVVDIMPRAAAAYAMVGAPVNPTGLDFEAVTARTAPATPDQVLISGALRNLRDDEIVSPPVRLALLDAHGAEIGHAVVRIDAAPVLPGKVQGFAALIADPGARAAGVGVAFVLSEPATQAQRSRHGASPARPEAHRPLPHADAAPLRPALGPTAPVATTLQPVDATPVDAVPVDNPGHDAVSPAHHG